jgi:hypothetical protein
MVMTLIAAVPKNSHEEFRISCEEFHGHNLISIKVSFAAEDGSWHPSKGNGISIRPAVLPEILAALAKAQGEAER